MVQGVKNGTKLDEDSKSFGGRYHQQFKMVGPGWRADDLELRSKSDAKAFQISQDTYQPQYLLGQIITYIVIAKMSALAIKDFITKLSHAVGKTHKSPKYPISFLTFKLLHSIALGSLTSLYHLDPPPSVWK
ncbi:hypothetical protein CEXT_635491 [Caerostris extrusa]|uniref:Uncharacterized protein n=1 Tax=Caerostris extrusa TaxID=172846 RepID=A0AAV4XNH9_CAEEX|nr:hypothetical protein CEXT_635491 [Caerostris extrusa]